jgi:hypothetical protein
MPATKDIIQLESEPSELRPVPARSHRPSPVIEAQLVDFLATLPPGVTTPPPDDFAGQIQWESWKNHRRELEAELDQALEAELAGSDLQFAFSGAPVIEYDIAAGFLGNFISKAQSLLFALAQATEQKSTEMERLATTLIEDYRLFISDTFASPLGVKFRRHAGREIGPLRMVRTLEVVEQFCVLLDAQLPSGDLLKMLSSPRVRARYYELLELVAKEDARVTVRTKTRPSGVRLDAKQARDLTTWMDSLAESTSTLPLESILTGGGGVTSQFEIQVGD